MAGGGRQNREIKTPAPVVDPARSQPPASEPAEGHPVRVLILCSAPLIAGALGHAPQGGPRPLQTWAAAHPEEANGVDGLSSDVVIVAPQTWEEMGRWLPALNRRFGSAMWLVWSRLRVAGMFCASLERHLCTIVGTAAAPEEFRTSFWSLVNHAPECPPAMLMARIGRGVVASQRAQRPVALTPRQVQCGCAVSLGLSNALIGGALSIAEGTVAKHVGALLHALDLHDREEAGALFELAAFPGSTSF